MRLFLIMPLARLLGPWFWWLQKLPARQPAGATEPTLTGKQAHLSTREHAPIECLPLGTVEPNDLSGNSIHG